MTTKRHFVITAAGCNDIGYRPVCRKPAFHPLDGAPTPARDRLANGGVRLGACCVRIPTWGRSWWPGGCCLSARCRRWQALSGLTAWSSEPSRSGRGRCRGGAGHEIVGVVLGRREVMRFDGGAPPTALAAASRYGAPKRTSRRR